MFSGNASGEYIAVSSENNFMRRWMFKLGMYTGATFAGILWGMIVLRVVGYATEQQEPTLTVPNAFGASVDFHRVTDLERGACQLGAARSTHLRLATP